MEVELLVKRESVIQEENLKMQSFLVPFVHSEDGECEHRFLPKEEWVEILALTRAEVKLIISLDGFWENGSVPRCNGKNGCGGQFVTRIYEESRVCDGKGGEVEIIRVERV